MRTLFEIIESAKDGEMPSHEECYWAMLALDSLGTFDRSALRNIAAELPNPNKVKIELECGESFRRFKRVLNTNPKRWMGPHHNPKNPECQKMRRLGKRLADKILKDANDENQNK